MNANAPQPTARRVLSLVWFPFFFAAAFAVMALFSYAHPEPNDMAVGVVGQTAGVSTALQHVNAGGFDIRSVSSTGAAKTLVENGVLAAAFDGNDVYVASAASSSRADYIRAIAPAVAGTAVVVTDVAPVAAGDVSGVGLFFYALPNLLVGLITSIVLLQFGMWPMRKKLLTIAATGAFASLFTFVLATSRDVIPQDGWLLLYAFVLTQAIGWLTTAAALYAKQYFMPVAMTFVLILGIPSSGGTVNTDMLPSFIHTLSSWLPFAQFIDIVRSSAYLQDTGLIRPLTILIGWAVLGAALLALHEWGTTKSSPAAPAVVAESPAADAAIFGYVHDTSATPVNGAAVILLDETGNEVDRGLTDSSGRYFVGGLHAGIHHVLVTSRSLEPAVATVSLQHSDTLTSRKFVVQDWNDPAGNLTAEVIGETDGHDA